MQAMGTLMENTAFEAVYRTSQAVMMSMARPYAIPCVAAITGYGHRSMALMQSWNDRTWSRCCKARREGSFDIACESRAETDC